MPSNRKASSPSKGLSKVRKAWSKVDGGKGPVEGSKYEERTEPKAEKRVEKKAGRKAMIGAGLKFGKQHDLPKRAPKRKT